MSQQRRHENLWLEDGNVVLCDEDVLFKVHRSILSRLSPFFLSHFNTHWHELELFDGCPMIQLDVGVANSQDLEALLWHLYHQKSVVRRISIWPSPELPRWMIQAASSNFIF